MTTYLPDDPAWIDYATDGIEEATRLVCRECHETVLDGRYDCRCTMGEEQ